MRRQRCSAQSKSGTTSKTGCTPDHQILRSRLRRVGVQAGGRTDGDIAGEGDIAGHPSRRSPHSPEHTPRPDVKPVVPLVISLGAALKTTCKTQDVKAADIIHEGATPPPRAPRRRRALRLKRRPQHTRLDAHAQYALRNAGLGLALSTLGFGYCGVWASG
jgi:hypothetical protein